MKENVFNPYSFHKLKISQSKEILKDIILSSVKLAPVQIDRPIIIYGGGSLGKMAQDFFSYLKIPFLYTVDVNAPRKKLDQNGPTANLIHPLNVKKEDKENYLLVICIVNAPQMEIKERLTKEGWKHVEFFYDISQKYVHKYPLNNGWFLEKLTPKDKNNIKKVFSNLGDNISKAHYTQFLAWRKNRCELAFDKAPINIPNRFFIPEVVNHLTSEETFVDCGAHYGSVSQKFAHITHNKYRQIFAIEPDIFNLKTLRNNLKGLQRLKTLDCALGSRNGKRNFRSGFGFSSKLGKKGESVTLSTLDTLSINPTFIKMHLEGGELEALKGGVKTITKCRPIIASTIYHNSDGVWKIPLFIMQNTNQYEYHIRLHSWAGTGAVLYAIPKERIKK